MDDDTLPFQPPEPDYVSEKYVLKVPITDKHLDNPWELRKYATKLMSKKMGDDVQLTSLRVKKPNRVSRGISKLLKRVPQVKLYVTIKF